MGRGFSLLLLPGEMPNHTILTVTQQPSSAVKKVHPSVGLAKLIASLKAPMPPGDPPGTVTALPLMVSVGFIFMEGLPRHPFTSGCFQPQFWLIGWFKWQDSPILLQGLAWVRCGDTKLVPGTMAKPTLKKLPWENRWVMAHQKMVGEESNHLPRRSNTGEVAFGAADARSQTVAAPLPTQNWSRDVLSQETTLSQGFFGELMLNPSWSWLSPQLFSSVPTWHLCSARFSWIWVFFTIPWVLLSWLNRTRQKLGGSVKSLPLPKSCAQTWFIRREHLPEKLVSTSCPCFFSGIGGMSSEVLQSTFPLDERRHQVLVFWKVGLLLASIRIHGCPSRATDVYLDPWMPVQSRGHPSWAMDAHPNLWPPNPNIMMLQGIPPLLFPAPWLPGAILILLFHYQRIHQIWAVTSGIINHGLKKPFLPWNQILRIFKTKHLQVD